jgi:hypothetical protein
MVSFHVTKRMICESVGHPEHQSLFSRAERLIVILYVYEGMTYEDIGLVIDVQGSEIKAMYASIYNRVAFLRVARPQSKPIHFARYARGLRDRQ